MTNNWMDLGNSTAFYCMGANPSENHPASMAHINKARAKGATLVVVDPRKTRTALQADRYIRIRPGTDIAFINGVVRGIYADMEARSASDPVRVSWYDYLNQTSNGSFFTDGTTTLAVVDESKTLAGTTAVALAKPLPISGTVVVTNSTGTVVYTEGTHYTVSYTAGTITRVATGTITDGQVVLVDYTARSSRLRTDVAGSAKYSDARFLVKTDGSDYEREVIATGTYDQISNFPMKAANVTASANTVYNRLKAHVAPYTSSVVADICGCTEADIAFVTGYFIANSRCSSRGTITGRSVTIPADTVAGVTATDVYTTLTFVIAGSVTVKNAAETVTYVEGTDYTVTYATGMIKRIVTGSIAAAAVAKVTATGTAHLPSTPGFKALTMLYAMGITQHTYGAQNCKSFAVIQTLMGNMGRAGGGINALRGIHNVQGSTDMGLLYGNIPAYSANPSVKRSVDANAFGKYMDALWGTPLSGTGLKGNMNGSYDDAYTTSQMALQQRGFYNMTLKWFGNYAWTNTLTDAAQRRAAVDALYDLWPKGNGDNHTAMFRAMARPEGDALRTTAAVVWGQNPAVTEPNQSKVRDGLRNLDLLVVTDLFATETALCQRKDSGVTYLIPTCSYVEEAGSVTNSGRSLQWRERTTTPRGNSKADLELLLTLAQALETAGAFSHIKAVLDGLVTSMSMPAYGSIYALLHGNTVGWTPGGATAFEDLSAASVDQWSGLNTSPVLATVKGSEAAAEMLFREYAGTVANGGTSWIYTGGYDTTRTTNKHSNQVNWQTDNRAKSRNNTDPNGTLAYPGWGYSWLVNRRVFYNNSEVPGDVADFFMGPDSCSRLFVSTNTSVLNYARWYRTIHRLADKPDTCLTVNTAPHVLPGRFPAHTEPYETPRADLAATWGRNTKGGAAWDLVTSAATGIAATEVYGKTTFVAPASIVSAAATTPAIGEALVLTTIRCVEHFQGGPTTRNNSWNVEAEPVPWIEISSTDARSRGISDGDWVDVVTVRSNSISDQHSRTRAEAAGFSKGFKARVGVGLQSNQRVASGVVAIPWHWGDAGLGTGSRANDLCLDAGDANTMIPEYKACICWIKKA